MKTKDMPILLLTGYLGSGKTTLLNYLLSNREGIKFAVIVNDIGEVNIDAELIQKGGIVGQKEDSLVALQNGCICCTLRTDLIEQIFELMKMQRFDYIVIEASGVCEPEPIARTICSIPQLGGAYTKYGTCRLDNIVTVVDALRLQSEFDCGKELTRKDLEEEDIANLLIQQIEFCSTILLNKASEVSPEELARIRSIIRNIQPRAEIIECDYAKVDLDKIVGTHRFDYEKVATSAAWIHEIERPVTEEEEAEAHAHEGHHHNHEHEEHEHDHEHEAHDHDHEHGHHHHDHEHHHDEGETEEYGISSFVYYRRPAFDIHKFDRFLATKWPRNVIRAKGVCYFAHNRDMSFLFEQAGRQKQITEAGLWYATMPEDELIEMMKREPGLVRDWDERYGDRMQKIVFIGQHLDKEQLIKDLDACLE